MNADWRMLLLSDFNVDGLSRYLNHSSDPPAIHAAPASPGETEMLMRDSDHPEWSKGWDTALVWVRPEVAVPAFRRALAYEAVSDSEIIEETKSFGRLITDLPDGLKGIFVPLWHLPPSMRGLGTFDLKSRSGLSRRLQAMNYHLVDTLDADPRVYPVQTASWIQAHGPRAFQPKLWYMAKVPFGQEVLKSAASDLKQALLALSGQSRKALILDMDNTLWGGEVGEVGWRQLVLGGHHAEGEAFLDFQKGIKNLSRRGVILGLASKNDEAVALEAVRNHPEMHLNDTDFAAWRINWDDKARNVVDLAEAMNIGLDAIVFIDDHPAERDRIRQALPNVAVPEWPSDPALFRQTLDSLPYWDTPLTAEDRGRAEAYRAERARKSAREELPSIEAWLESLEIRVHLEEVGPENISRVTQLLNKTNQMNLTTRRLTEEELTRWLETGDRAIRAARVSDRFGDAGLTGIVSVERRGDHLAMTDFVLSCRVMGRGVESVLLGQTIEWGIAWSTDRVVAAYESTKANGPCLSFFSRSGMTSDDSGHVFSWPTDQPFPLPSHIQVEGAGGGHS